jgi:H+/gluconate symporter-like permease
MTTIVNSPTPAQTTSTGGIGFLIGAIILVGFFIALIYFGLPMLQRMSSGTVQLNLPSTEVVIPNKVDVNITKNE